MATQPIVFSAAVEGIVDEALLRKLCQFVGAMLGPVYGRNGKAYILQRLPGYNHSARFRHWVVMLDLDNDASCVPEILPTWLTAPSRLMRLRVAVKETEAWLLGDRERLSGFLSVPTGMIPPNPETVADPKQLIVNLARRSRRKAIREDIVPLPGSGQSVGPAYTSRLVQFIHDEEHGWRPEKAADYCDSLRRCIRAMSQLMTEPL